MGTRSAPSGASRVVDVLRPPVVKLRRAIIAERERRAGIATTGYIPPEELGFSEESCGYMASSWTTLNRILRRSEVSSDDVFVDFGCGKGRVIYQAAIGYPFRRVEGVELSPELTAAAQQNLDHNRGRFRCQDVKLVTADVREYEIPDDVTVAYVYNAFTGTIFQAVIDNLVESVRRAPRRLRLIYLNPQEGTRVEDAGFREVRRLRGLRPGDRDRRGRLYELT